MKRALADFSVLLLIVVLTVGGLLVWLLATESGLRRLLAVANELAPGVLEYQTATGSLLEGFTLEGVGYADPALAVRVETLRFGWDHRALRARQLLLGPLLLRGVEVRQLAAPEPKPEQPPPAIPTLALPWPVDVSELKVEDFIFQPHGGAPLAVQRLRLSARMDGGRLTIRQLEGAGLGAEFDLQGDATLEPALPVQVALSWAYTLPDGRRLAGAGTIEGNLQRLVVKQALSAPAVATLETTLLQVLDPGRRWQAMIRVPPVSLKRIDAGLPAHVVGMDLRGEGDLQALSVQGALDLRPLGLPRYRGRIDAGVELAGRVALRALQLEQVEGDARLALTGYIDGLAETPRADLVATWSKLDGAPFGAPGWSSARGELKAAGTMADARLLLDAEVRGKPLKARGNLQQKGAREYDVSLDLDAPRTRLELAGRVGPRLDVAWRVDGRELGAWLPGVRGDLRGSGRVLGLRERPDVEARLESRQLHYGTVESKGLKLVASTRNGLEQARLDLDLERLKSQELVLALSAHADGGIKNHRIELDLRQDGRALSLAAAGGWDQNRWSGSLQRLRIADPRAGTWNLPAPAAVQAGASAVRVGDLCLRRDRGDLCLTAEGDPQGTLVADVRLQRFSSAWLKPWLPETLGIQTEADAKASLELYQGKPQRGRIDLTLAPGQVNWKSGDTPLQLSWTRNAWSATVAGERLRARWELAAQAGTNVAVEVAAIAPWSDPDWQRRPLSGTLRLDVPDLQRFAARTGQEVPLRGRVDGNLRLAGSVLEPRVNGRLAMRQGSLPVPQAGITLERMDVVIDALGDRFRYRADGESGGGEVEVEGDLRRGAEGGWKVASQVKGRQFLAMNLPDTRVVIVPALNLTADTAAQSVRVEGSVRVPEAMLRAGGAPGVVEPSKDVVVVRAEEPPAEKPSPWKIAADVRVDLGEKVQVAAQGFTGRITGGMTIRQVPGREPVAVGELRIEDGKYSTYGTTLAISEGRVIYANAPLTRPSIRVRSERVVNDVTVALEATGRADSPRVLLTSSRPMNQTEILALLLTGKPLTQVGEEEGDALTGAVSAAGIAGGNLLARRIGQTVGLEDFKVTSEGDIGQAAVQVGRALSPRLYLQYGVGLFDASQIVRIRYQLSEHWSVQTETGTESGGDLLWTLEK